MTKHKIYLLLFAIAMLGLVSCKKYLDAKSNQSLSTPETVDDLQALADNFYKSTPTSFNNHLSDEYYIDYSSLWLQLDKEWRDSYVWAADLNTYREWVTAYANIFHYNTILDNLEKIPAATNPAKWNAIKGTALFFRAYLHFGVAQLYAPQYDESTSATDLGIPLRLTSDFNMPSFRSTVKETYDQIISDIKEAATLLPENTLPVTRLYKLRPTRVLCNAMLAKVYLQMGDYATAYQYANLSLTAYDDLLDFNDPAIDVNSLAPFPTYDNNSEILLYVTLDGPLNSYEISYVDSLLYQSYDDNDLRKQVYFEPTVDENGTPAHYYQGPYSGVAGLLFNGIANDEIYLIRAETAARLGNAQGAMDDLNYVLERRWATGTYIAYTGMTAEAMLPIILQERKKELVARGTRWSDLKRLNKEPVFATTIRRNLNGQEYILPPNDNRYALLIPFEVIIKTSLPQNPR